jgi:hypothetical protein
MFKISLVEIKLFVRFSLLFSREIHFNWECGIAVSFNIFWWV